ncbi:CHAT domain-containing protein [Micromonospora terminaliae]|uniref:CHAT domain-containing protein n=1 Tax=Micromonospora terminaliae TaxID=1914461 RepID=A0AAJ2ZDP7_9ACTN|nr:CHAT domain-containing protein [Micromonospora terminaliae]NES28087.1 CHAT domain-containing protein [Micromonospora terminaliae]QGL47164.1 CHAT domain-containing protein [Micromonospora terminaliae]
MTTAPVEPVKLWHQLVQMIATDPSVEEHRDVLADRLTAENVTRRTLEILLRFTDAHAAGGTIVSRDGPFTYIAQTVGDQVGTTSVGWLHLQFFERVLRLWHDDQKLAEIVRQGTYRNDYLTQIDAIDKWLDAQRARTDLDERPALVRQRDPSGALSIDRWPLLLAGSPRISQVPMEYLRANVAALPRHPTTLPDYGEDPDSYHQAAQTLLAAAKAADEDFDAYAKVRLGVALDLVRRRRFAKVRMLELGWPDLMERVRTPGGIRRLRQLEASILGDTDVEAPSDAWRAYESDERLSEFLRIPPHFRTIFDGQLTRVVGAVEGQPPPAEPNVEWAPYTNVALRLDPPDVARATHQPEQSRWQGIAALTTASGNYVWPVEIDIGELRSAAASLRDAYVSASTTSLRPNTTLRDVARLPDAAVLVEQIGEVLWRQTLGADAEATSRFLTALTGNPRVRLTVSSGLVDLTDLPWECLRIPALRVMAGLTVKLSVVRLVNDAINEAHRAVGATLRVLAVHSEPRGVAPLPGARQELRLLRESFAEAEQKGWASVTTIEDATERDLRESLRRVRPHILHYTGHGGIDHTEGVAALILHDDDGDPFLLTADELAVQLWDSGVVLAVLSGCDTGVTPGTADRATFGVCQSIVRQGVPAAIATTRTVFDNAALRFAQEFYQAFIDGYPLEACLSEARKGLFMQGWDWSAWALFAADPAMLELIRLRRLGGMS